tara:strand:+ start:434 stop:934 length:501 start_codon:yes stop_codon:yes gene_type:complete
MSGTDLEILIPKLRRFARALYCDKTEADDAVCDSLETAIAAGHVSGGELITTDLWLFNAMIAGARRRFANDGGQPAGSTLRGCPVDIEQAMAELGVEHRAVIALHVVEGIGLQDVSVILGMSQSAVRENLLLAREHIAARSDAGHVAAPTPTRNPVIERFGSAYRD